MRYFFTELRESWSYIYYLDVSKEVAASMAKLEIAKYKGNKIMKSSSADVDNPKRKTHNIRKHYCTICNTIRKEASFMNICEKDETETNNQSNGDVNSILLRSPLDIQDDDKFNVQC
ncbi:hypothetical protein TSUD_125160 [Trifolium subterraneum]|uniref:Uncharacterized protein n=1 Tax=Trifolium subterraneum TaxID=3900 RepID=A0A2Z6M9E5_TRISU|nr:hypothetical protein TSUD_125160 [Trifolium subterraneum]